MEKGINLRCQNGEELQEDNYYMYLGRVYHLPKMEVKEDEKGKYIKFNSLNSEPKNFYEKNISFLHPIDYSKYEDLFQKQADFIDSHYNHKPNLSAQEEDYNKQNSIKYGKESLEAYIASLGFF
jgi:hypothetical protein